MHNTPHANAHTSRFTIPLRNTAILACLLLTACDRPGRSSVDTSAFDGKYELIADRSFRLYRAELAAAAEDDPQRNLTEQIIKDYEDQYANFTIDHGVIRSGKQLVQQFTVRSAATDGDTLRAEAMWHEDMYDEGDYSIEIIRLIRHDDGVLEFIFGEEGAEDGSSPVFFRRVSD